MRILAALLLLAACSGGKPTDQPEAQDLEAAAIERGLIPDPRDTEIAGLYARDTDRICIVPAESGYRIGAYVDYGDGIACSGSGTINRAGETLRISLGEGDACSFDAKLAGGRIVFPGALPEGCGKLCAGRASFAGLEVERMSESVAEAAAMRDAGGRRLCGN